MNTGEAELKYGQTGTSSATTSYTSSGRRETAPSSSNPPTSTTGDGISFVPSRGCPSGDISPVSATDEPCDPIALLELFER
eukprot:CAMPEP_0114492422 /NCGR_PEP_ID=MMETSP0109-20121206/3544_1 /TAXON_ID=29199 /ORGANISM="Chlorarachnion reptans, Strain CCCM449" /LENGTH=80 /DNA_ID=CAMNT_0001669259 /DNA_START=422 /DNA_END=664 /DNA_ORIENTATION=+